MYWSYFCPSRKIPQATDLQSPPPSVKTITSSSPSSIAATSSSSLHSKIRTGSHISSSLKTGSSSFSVSRGLGRPPTAVQSENTGGSGSSIGGSHLVSPSKPAVVRQVASGRPKNPVGRPSKQMLKLREEAAAAAALRKRKAPSQEGEHSGPDRNCIILQDRGRPPSASSSTSLSSSSKPPIHSSLPHGQTNGTLSPSSKHRPQPSPSESHSQAAKAVWTYRRTHTLGHSSPPDPSSATNNSHNRGGMGDSGLHGQSSGRGIEHQGLVKKRKGSGMEEHSPSSKPSAHRLPTSSSSSATSSSPRTNFYPWKESKGGGLAGGMEKKLGTQKVSLNFIKLEEEEKNPYSSQTCKKNNLAVKATICSFSPWGWTVL